MVGRLSGAARVAEREILKLGVEYGWDRFHALERAWFDYSEARMIAAIRKLPAGTGAAENMRDRDAWRGSRYGRRFWE
jgi:N-methylhydantoinase B